MIIRKAQLNDINQIIRLCKAHAAYEKATFNDNNKAELLTRYLFEKANGLQCLVVEEHQHLIGYATFIKQFSTWDADYYVYLDCLFLDDSVRGQGIGTQLMAMIKEYAVSEHCFTIQWQTPNFNTNAIRFYKKLGAQSLSKERFFFNCD